MRRCFIRVANISSSIEKISIDPTNVIAILIKQSDFSHFEIFEIVDKDEKGRGGEKERNSGIGKKIGKVGKIDRRDCNLSLEGATSWKGTTQSRNN